MICRLGVPMRPLRGVLMARLKTSRDIDIGVIPFGFFYRGANFGPKCIPTHSVAFWRNHASRYVVATTALGLFGVLGFYRLLHLGGLPGRLLLLGSLSLALLFARTLW